MWNKLIHTKWRWQWQSLSSVLLFVHSPRNSPGQHTGVGSLSLLQGISQPRDRTQVSPSAGGFFTSWATREAQEYWSGKPIPSPGDLPNPGVELRSPALQVDTLPTMLSGKAALYVSTYKVLIKNLAFGRDSINRSYYCYSWFYFHIQIPNTWNVILSTNSGLTMLTPKIIVVHRKGINSVTHKNILIPPAQPLPPSSSSSL